MSNQAVHRFECTVVGATSVTLEEVAGLEAQPGDIAMTQIVVTVGATPPPYFWATGQKYLLRLDRAG